MRGLAPLLDVGNTVTELKTYEANIILMRPNEMERNLPSQALQYCKPEELSSVIEVLRQCLEQASHLF